MIIFFSEFQAISASIRITNEKFTPDLLKRDSEEFIRMDNKYKEKVNLDVALIIELFTVYPKIYFHTKAHQNLQEESWTEQSP